MSDFTKAKIGFAVALLVALFTIHPVLVTTAGTAITVFSAPVKLVWPYYTVIGLLSLSVYVYALAFLSNRDESLAERFGNFLYAAALLTPLLCLLVWSLSTVTELLLKAIPQIPLILTSIVSSILGAAAAMLISRRLNTRDRESKVEALDREEGFYMERATAMLQ
jgi:hypothetical protein